MVGSSYLLDIVIYFLGMSLNISSSYHPQTDGQTERFNCMLKEYLRHFVDARQKNWVQLLDVAQFCFNSQTGSSIGKSLFEIVSGRQQLLHHIVDHLYVGKNPQAHNFMKEWKQTIDIARAYLEKASKHMKKWEGKKRRPFKFRVGYQVLIKLKESRLLGINYMIKDFISKRKNNYKKYSMNSILISSLGLTRGWKVKPRSRVINLSWGRRLGSGIELGEEHSHDVRQRHGKQSSSTTPWDKLDKVFQRFRDRLA
ncbi:reverse transcriptase [Cucumis melo var. makuwa]|uniref:Reverse transcriptase n=1 Tax=Cucumis melo var. makuwa TaxID=1194695 RepID=A0A5D3C4V8_CUCMM|nr:reverse transcriptase [Cucumis melo var. makuwa]